MISGPTPTGARIRWGNRSISPAKRSAHDPSTSNTYAATGQPARPEATSTTRSGSRCGNVASKRLLMSGCPVTIAASNIRLVSANHVTAGESQHPGDQQDSRSHAPADAHDTAETARTHVRSKACRRVNENACNAAEQQQRMARFCFIRAQAPSRPQDPPRSAIARSATAASDVSFRPLTTQLPASASATSGSRGPLAGALLEWSMATTRPAVPSWPSPLLRFDRLDRRALASGAVCQPIAGAIAFTDTVLVDERLRVRGSLNPSDRPARTGVSIGTQDLNPGPPSYKALLRERPAAWSVLQVGLSRLTRRPSSA